MLLLTAAEIRETTHIVADGTIAASKLAAGAAADGEVDGRKVVLHLPKHVDRPSPLTVTETVTDLHRARARAEERCRQAARGPGRAPAYRYPPTMEPP